MMKNENVKAVRLSDARKKLLPSANEASNKCMWAGIFQSWKSVTPKFWLIQPCSLRTETILQKYFNALSTQLRHSEDDNVKFYCVKTVKDTRPMPLKPNPY